MYKKQVHLSIEREEKSVKNYFLETKKIIFKMKEYYTRFWTARNTKFCEKKRSPTSIYMCILVKKISSSQKLETCRDKNPPQSISPLQPIFKNPYLLFSSPLWFDVYVHGCSQTETCSFHQPTKRSWSAKQFARLLDIPNILKSSDQRCGSD